MHSTRIRIKPLTICGLLLGAIVFALHYNYIVNHFLVHGAYLLDSGFFAGLVYHNPTLQNPLAVMNGSYYSIHFSPILSIFSLFSYLLPVPLPFYYALTQGLIFAGVTAGAYACLQGFFPERTSKCLLALSALTLLFSCNGILLASAAFPHFEAVYAAFALLFFAALAADRPALSWVFFVLVVLVREDTGFHLFGYLSMLFLVTWLEPELARYRRLLGLFAILSFMSSIGALAMQRVFFASEGESSLSKAFLGDPIFSHLNGDFLKDRFARLWSERAYVWFPWLLCLPGALALRSWRLAVGFIAVLPWFLFCALAVNDTVGSLFSYYAFPFLVSLVWPSVCYSLGPQNPAKRKGLLSLQILMLLSSFALFTINQEGGLNVVRTATNYHRVKFSDYREIEKVVEHYLKQPDVLFDSSMAALFPHRIPPSRRYFQDGEVPPAQGVLGFSSSFYFPQSIRIMSQNKLIYEHKYRRLPVFFSSHQDETHILGRTWGSHKGNRDSLLGLMMLHPGELAMRDPDDLSIVSAKEFNQPRILAQGSHSSLAPGSYRASFEFQADSPTKDSRVVCQILAPGELARLEVPLEGKNGVFTLDVPFQLSPEQVPRPVEFRLWKSGAFQLRLRGVDLSLDPNEKLKESVSP